MDTARRENDTKMATLAAAYAETMAELLKYFDGGSYEEAKPLLARLAAWEDKEGK